MSTFAMRQAAVIIRREFVARVWTPIFLLTLIAPLLIVVVSGLVAAGSTTSLTRSMSERRVVMVTDAVTAGKAQEASRRLGSLLSGDASRTKLMVRAPEGRPSDQLRRLVVEADGQIGAVSFDGGDRSVVVRLGSDSEANYLALLRREAARPKGEPSRTIDRIDGTPEIIGKAGRLAVTYGLVLALVFGIQMFSAQTMASLLEERSSRLIDSLAAAAPLEALLFGKIVADFAATAIFVGTYALAILALPALLPAGISDIVAKLGHEAGWSTLALFLVYFAMAYLINSTMMIGLTSIATTPQAAKTLATPAYVSQLVFSMIALVCMTEVGSPAFVAAAIFPVTSPTVMLGGHLNGLRPAWHAIAIIWQMLWVFLLLRFAARTFRRTALGSASTPLLRMRRQAAVDAA